MKRLFLFYLRCDAQRFLRGTLDSTIVSYVKARYGIVVLAVGQYEAAHFIRRVLRHHEFRTQVSRMGAVIRVMQTGVVAWRLNALREVRISWPD